MQVKTASSHPVPKEKKGKKATAQVAEEVMMIVVIYKAFVQLFLMEVSICKGTGMCQLWVSVVSGQIY